MCGCGFSPRKLYLPSFAMPTTSFHQSWPKNLKRLPIASWSGQNCFAIVSLITTTCGASRWSVAAKSRPRLSGMPIVSK